jgi:hypothetical protein
VIIIIEKISRDTTRQDLINFIQPALKGYFFQKTGQLGYVKTVKYTDNLTERESYHGMFLVTSGKVAARVIKKLNN